jgi:C4-dicarboxylate transporter/malic acid transport protein
VSRQQRRSYRGRAGAGNVVSMMTAAGDATRVTPVDPGPAAAPPAAASPAAASPAPVPGATGRGWLARRGLLADLEHPGLVFASITPNWFACVMGTGIVAVAAASLPEQFPGLRAAATVVWALAAALLAALLLATGLHWRRYRAAARGHAAHPVIGLFYGAPPMAIVTVGTGTLLLGGDVIGPRAAVDADWACWLAGAALGLVVAVSVPLLQWHRGQLRPERAFGGWLMPVVPPMVSASAGALLIPYAGAARLALLLACSAMFGISLVAAGVVIALIWRRLATRGLGPARLVPTLWIILGPLGQSVTAANLLGRMAPLAVSGRDAAGLHAFGLWYGFPVEAIALAWAGVAAVLTARTARRGLPFSLTWWSFTFPVGTCVTGMTGLALATGWAPLRVAAAAGYAALVLAWLTVAARTARASARGWLFLPPVPE